MTFRAPGAIAPPHVTVVGTHLFENPPRVRATYEEGNKVWAPTLTLTFLPWLNTIILDGDHTSREYHQSIKLISHVPLNKSKILPSSENYPEFWARCKRNPPPLSYPSSAAPTQTAVSLKIYYYPQRTWGNTPRHMPTSGHNPITCMFQMTTTRLE